MSLVMEHIQNSQNAVLLKYPNQQLVYEEYPSQIMISYESSIMFLVYDDLHPLNLYWSSFDNSCRKLHMYSNEQLPGVLHDADLDVQAKGE